MEKNEMTDITASLDSLVKQGAMTASQYMSEAISEIDVLFGDGYAKQNPVLVAAFMQAATTDLGATVQAKVLGEALEKIGDALEEIADIQINKK